MSLEQLLDRVAALPQRHDGLVTYSPKVFIPLTRLCRDVCHYCTFAHSPRTGDPAYLSIAQVLDLARAGAARGCHEALFTLGDKPELRYAAARDALRVLGHETTLSYLVAACGAVLDETSLLPHVNAGVMTLDELAALREVSVSQGLMLESVAERLCDRGGPHHGSPDKHPEARLATIRDAGRLSIPFTSGILIGIGETRAERVAALVALRRLHDRYGHLQEIIIQGFRAKPGTRMARAPEPDLKELCWTIAAARLVFGPDMPIQSPPNLTPIGHDRMIAAGLNDWGGISPVTIDHVNPEAPWPEIRELERSSAAAGRVLVERLAVHPRHLRDDARWLAAAPRRAALRAADAMGLARMDPWHAGGTHAPPKPTSFPAIVVSPLRTLLRRIDAGAIPDEADIATLFSARNGEVAQLCAIADARRRASVGDSVGFVANRNLNYTNICRYACAFCAFSKASRRSGLRDDPYDLDLSAIADQAREAAAQGATEICMQGGIHPRYDGETYLRILRTVKDAAPALHIHAFSPLEVHHGAATLGMSVARFLGRLRDGGLGSLPGTAAEILDDGVRARICPDKLTSAEWLAVVEAAHRAGLPTTATIMFGHVDAPVHWARHLSAIRSLQERTGGITEFVPLPFVHEEAPLFRAGLSRRGPTWRETLLMHAVARLALDPVIANIQVSWVKLGRAGAVACLDAGANDLGGTLMRESISRAAGAAHGQAFPTEEMRDLIVGAGRLPRQRTTLYADADRSVPIVATGCAHGETVATW